MEPNANMSNETLNNNDNVFTTDVERKRGLLANSLYDGRLEKKSLTLYHDYPLLEILFPPHVDFLKCLFVPNLKDASFQPFVYDKGYLKLVWHNEFDGRNECELETCLDEDGLLH